MTASKYVEGVEERKAAAHERQADRIAMSCWGVQFVLERRYLPSAQEVVLVTSDGSAWPVPPPPGYEVLIAAQGVGAVPAGEVSDATTVSLSPSVLDDLDDITLTEGELP